MLLSARLVGQSPLLPASTQTQTPFPQLQQDYGWDFRYPFRFNYHHIITASGGDQEKGVP